MSTLAITRKLEAAGLERKVAEAIAASVEEAVKEEAIKQGQEDAAAKSDVENLAVKNKRAKLGIVVGMVAGFLLVEIIQMAV